MTIIVRSMYNFVNCLQFNIRYEKVERPAPVGGALVVAFASIEISKKIIFSMLKLDTNYGFYELFYYCDRFMELKNFLLCSVDYVKVIKERTFFFK